MTDAFVAENMAIWDQVKATDPEYTKATNNGRFDFTSVDPQYQLQEATKLWGPYGDHWGLRNLNFQILEPLQIIMLQAEFFYPNDAKEVSFPIAVDMKLKCGDDCCKKLITSARSKSLSYLGFSADVFMGMFDDAQYVKDAEIRFGEQNAFLTKAIAQIRVAADEAALDKCESRATELIANETIDAASGAQLMAEIAKRRGTFR